MSVLELRDVHASYGKRVVLQGASLKIDPGEWFCLLGPNGVGKSTLLHCVATRIQPTQGTIRIDGIDLTRQPDEAKRALGFGCAPDQLPDLLTGRQCLNVFSAAKGLRSIDEDIGALSDALRFTPYMDDYVDTYSLGTRQKLCVLLALVGGPKLIVLDEAFNGLDPRSSLLVKHELKLRLRNGVAVLLATHSLDIVEHYADRAALLMTGRVVHEWSANDLRSLRAAGADLEAVLAQASDVMA